MTGFKNTEDIKTFVSKFMSDGILEDIMSASKYLFTALAVLLFAGCIVQSFNPHYTKEAKCTIPGIEGEWTLVAKTSNDKPVKPWIISGDKIMTYDEKGARGMLNAVYFRMGESFFLDTIAEGPPEGAVSEWWTMHLVPAHVVTRVDLHDNNLTLTPIDYNYLEKALEKGEIKLKHMKQKDDNTLLFTASSEEWMDFLKKYGKDKLIFSDENAVHLTRRAGGRD